MTGPSMRLKGMEDHRLRDRESSCRRFCISWYHSSRGRALQGKLLTPKSAISTLGLRADTGEESRLGVKATGMTAKPAMVRESRKYCQEGGQAAQRDRPP